MHEKPQEIFSFLVKTGVSTVNQKAGTNFKCKLKVIIHKDISAKTSEFAFSWDYI